MGLCVSCGKKAGFLRGSALLYEKEYCGSCLKKVLEEEKSEGLKQYKQTLNIPDNPIEIRYLEGFPQVDDFIRNNKLKIFVLIEELNKNNMLFWIENEKMMFALSPKVGEPQFMLENILHMPKKLAALKQGGMITEEEINETNNQLILKQDAIIIHSIYNSMDSLPVATIYKSDILFYSRLGDLYTKTAGGGYSFSGAVVGGIIAGGAGAIIGSRKNIDTEVVDERSTVLTIKDKGEIRNIFFSSDTIDVFLRVIPDKDITLVNVTAEEQTITSNEEEEDIIVKIEKLAALKAKGIITEDEFNKKRNNCLISIINTAWVQQF